MSERGGELRKIRSCPRLERCVIMTASTPASRASDSQRVEIESRLLG